MTKIKNTISNHNRNLLVRKNKSFDGCNCRTKDECPLDGNSLTKSIVYKADITSPDVGETKSARYANHNKPSTHLAIQTKPNFLSTRGS